MERAYLLIAGVLTGAGVGLIAGGGTAMVEWVAAGALMGLVLAIAARRPQDPVEIKPADSRRPTADGRF